MHTYKVVRDVMSGLQPHASPAGSQGLSVATLVSGEDGSSHVELAVCQLDPGGWVAGHLHPFEESFYVLEGSAEIGIGGAVHALVADDFGFVPFATPHAWRNPGDRPVRWYRVRAPQPRRLGPSDGTVPRQDHPVPQGGAPVVEEDPTVHFVGHFSDDDLNEPGSLSMPGYHGHRVRDISVRMMVDDVLGAVHHTVFMIQFAPPSGPGLSGSAHYHDFEEAYLVLRGEGEVVLEGVRFEVTAGDLVWQSSGTLHGWVNRGREPLRFIELQAPRPPFSNAVIFEDAWVAVAERASRHPDVARPA